MKKVTEAERQEIDRLAALPDEAIDTRNIPEITDWTGAERGRFYRPIKQQITLRMDADILAWFRAQGGQVPIADQLRTEGVCRYPSHGKRVIGLGAGSTD
jgi:uncharacterized protein (DUF4415 family)